MQIVGRRFSGRGLRSSLRASDVTSWYMIRFREERVWIKPDEAADFRAGRVPTCWPRDGGTMQWFRHSRLYRLLGHPVWPC